MRHVVNGVAVCAATLIATAASAQSPSCGNDLAGAQRADSPRYIVAYRLLPEKPAVSKHFSVEMVVCAKDQAPPPDMLRVDARMPAHGHGMNYKASVVNLGVGKFKADGMLFHMPGRWELVFDVVNSNMSERATHLIDFP